MIDKYVSMKPFQSRCEWWIPESSFKVAGTVEFDGVAIKTTMDRWVGPEHCSQFPRADVLHGHLPDETPITAFNTFVNAYENEFVTVLVYYLAVGAHLEPLNTQEFTRANVRIDGLPEWWSCTGIQVEHLPKGGSTVSCAGPAWTDWIIPSRSAEVGLAQSVRFTGGDGSPTLTVVYDSFLRVAAKSPQFFSWFHDLVEDIRQFLSLCLDQPGEHVSLSFENPDRSMGFDLIEWYWMRGNERKKEVERFRILLPFKSVQNEFDTYLNSWLSYDDNKKMARSLLFSTELSPAPFMEWRFLPVIQALEVYCNSFGSAKYIDDSQFKTIKNDLLRCIPDGLPVKLVGKLKSSLGWSNELSLHDKIVLILTSLEPETSSFVCNNQEKCATWLKNTRNYFTHYGDLRNKHLQGNALHWATKQASLLLKIVWLKDAGIPEKQIQQALQHSHRRVEGKRIWEEIEAGLSDNFAN